MVALTSKACGLHLSDLSLFVPKFFASQCVVRRLSEAKLHDEHQCDHRHHRQAVAWNENDSIEL